MRSPITAMVMTISPPPPAPSSARNTISCSMFCAMPQRADEKHRDRHLQDDLAAVEVAEFSVERAGDRAGEQIGRHHPGEVTQRRDRRPWSAMRSKRRFGRGRQATAPETARRTRPGWMSGSGLTPCGERVQNDISMTSTLMYIVERSVASVGCEQPFHVVKGLG